MHPMRNLIIIFLWILLGYWYYSISSTCCNPLTEKVTTDTQIENVTPVVKQSTTTDYVFPKSTVSSTKEDTSIRSILPLPKGKGIEIIGSAFSDEEDGHQLALLRAKEVQTKLNIPNNSVRIIANVSEEKYMTDRSFIEYSLYDLANTKTKVASEKIEFDGILREGKNIHFYIEEYDASSGLPKNVKDELAKTTWKLRNNFCKIELTSFNEDRVAGEKLCFEFKEQLIRSGLSPMRIRTVSKKLEDRTTAILELRIKE